MEIVRNIRDVQQLRFVQVSTMDELQAFWPFVRDGIEHIKKRDRSMGHLTPTHVYNGIRFGLPTAQPRTTAVELFLALEGKIPKAFMVTTPQQDPFRNNIPVGIYVWFLYADFKMLTQFLPELERLGKISGGEEIRFHSGRKGWLRNFGRMTRLGFDLWQYTFRKAL